jgi:hypothetical protein
VFRGRIPKACNPSQTVVADDQDLSYNLSSAQRGASWEKEKKMPSETELEYAKEFWTTANVVTGFSIIQMIAYFFALGGSDSKIREGVLEARPWVLSAIIFATVAYCMAAGVLGRWQISTLKQCEVPELVRRLFVVNLFRIIIITVTGAIGLVVTILPV